jgi:glycosyltransferase involved in cell wall biosynthesis
VQIDHLTFSKTGGAGIVAETIAKAQRALDHDAKEITVVESDLRSEPLKKPILTMAAALDEWALSSHREKTLFSPLRGNLESLDSSKIRPNSIIHLHWMPGVINHQRVKTLLDSGRKVVWTLHDMNPFTGGCHHSHDCEQFTNGCSSCPQARKAFRRIVSVNLQRRTFEGKYPNLRVVSPTTWMLDQASRSTVFCDQQNLVIANPIDDIFFEQTDGQRARAQIGTAVDAFVGAVVAKDLSDANKNLALVIKAFEEASLRTSRRLALILIGKNGPSYSSKLVDIKWLGEMSSKMISETACAADVFLSGSIAESAGMTIIEGAAMGIPTVALANGGTSSLIENEKTGILCPDPESLVAGVLELIENSKRLSELGTSAKLYAENHRAEKVATKYVELYRSMS